MATPTILGDMKCRSRQLQGRLDVHFGLAHRSPVEINQRALGVQAR
jgi:hypothetical protein